MTYINHSGGKLAVGGSVIEFLVKVVTRTRFTKVSFVLPTHKNFFVKCFIHTQYFCGRYNFFFLENMKKKKKNRVKSIKLMFSV